MFLMFDNSQSIRHAVIMAGGEGTRLRPITDTMPKPLVPIHGVPVIRRILKLLRRHGVETADITARYLAEQLTDALGQNCEGISLTYFIEDQPLGTAGSVKQALTSRRDFHDGSFLIISGDAVSESDLTTAMDFHRRTDADVTMILSHSSDVSRYGVVLCRADELSDSPDFSPGSGRILRFQEKPAPEEACSDTVNTGIYLMKYHVLDEIPDGVASDFGRDIFPHLLEKGKRLYGYIDSGYWCDIGTPESYYHCNMDYFHRESDLWTPTGSSTPEKKMLEGETNDSRITFYDLTVKNYLNSVIGEGCILAPTVTLDHCLLHDHVKIGPYSSLQGSILCRGCRIGREVIIGYGACLGEACVVEDGVVIGENARIPAFTHVTLESMSELSPLKNADL